MREPILTGKLSYPQIMIELGLRILFVQSMCLELRFSTINYFSQSNCSVSDYCIFLTGTKRKDGSPKMANQNLLLEGGMKGLLCIGRDLVKELDMFIPAVLKIYLRKERAFKHQVQRTVFLLQE